MSQIAEHENGLGYIVLYGTTDRQHVTYDEAQAMIVSKLTKRVNSAVSYRKQLDRLTKLLHDYSALAGRTPSAELQRKLDRAIAAADAKVAELTPKPRKKRRVRNAA